MSSACSKANECLRGVSGNDSDQGGNPVSPGDFDPENPMREVQSHESRRPPDMRAVPVIAVVVLLSLWSSRFHRIKPVPGVRPIAARISVDRVEQRSTVLPVRRSFVFPGGGSRAFDFCLCGCLLRGRSGHQHGKFNRAARRRWGRTFRLTGKGSELNMRGHRSWQTRRACDSGWRRNGALVWWLCCSCSKAPTC